jgi:hypothetical protein
MILRKQDDNFHAQFPSFLYQLISLMFCSNLLLNNVLIKFVISVEYNSFISLTYRGN